jgi:cytochrome c
MNRRSKPLFVIRLVLAATLACLVAVASGSGVRAKPAAFAGHAAGFPIPMGDAINGAKLYQACMGCHSLDENDVGPKHRGVIGRRAGSVAGYAYSSALKSSAIVWTPTNLDRWLTNPQALVPGTKMYFSIANPQSRADIIAYLAKQK